MFVKKVALGSLLHLRLSSMRAWYIITVFWEDLVSMGQFGSGSRSGAVLGICHNFLLC